MAMMDHWQPVLLTKSLQKTPVPVTICDRTVVVFRTGSGQIGVLDDMCPHRRMKLSLGKVCGERLQCTYHGWTFDCQGAGASPGTPKMYATAPSYDVRDAYGAIWVKPRAASAEFPQFPTDGYQAIRPLAYTVKAPLELVLDNFCEIEHTATTHVIFGYPLNGMEHVTCQCFSEGDSVRVVNHGPARPLSFFNRFLLGITKKYRFDDEWISHFSPVYSIFDHYWSDPKTGQESKARWRIIIALTPINDRETHIFVFPYLRSTHAYYPDWLVRCFHPYLRRFVDMELKLDVKVLEGLASQDPSLEGMKLSRFDRVLGMNRERINRVYRGIAASAEHSNGSSANGSNFVSPITGVNHARQE
jgi:phenylpropionate dioxygenase-like ring-hydroxylating dioxygenase large terminal subunit